MAKRFAAPVSDVQVTSFRATAMPTTTKAATEWGIHIWQDWASHRASSDAGTSSQSSDYTPVNTSLLDMPLKDLSYWMGKFVLEVPKKDKTFLKNT